MPFVHRRGGLNSRSANNHAVNHRTVLKQCTETALISFAESVELRAAISDALVSFEESVKAEVSGALISFNDQVATVSSTTFLARNGWYPVITINDSRIADGYIRDYIITHTENSASQLSLQLLLQPGVVDTDYYIGKSITIDCVKSDYSSYRVFTGKINLPELDLINGYLTLACSDMRDERMESELAGLAPTIGYYSTDVFGSGTGSVALEINNRLSTIPYNLDYTNYGGLTIHNFLAGSANYTLYNADVYRDDGRDPVIQKALRSRIINTINISLTYQYVRTYHRQRTFSWSSNYGSTCNFLTYGYDVAKREMIETAIKAAGWPLRGSVGYTPVLPSGWYRCNGYNLEWSTTQSSGVNVQVKDKVTGVASVDSKGDPIYKYVVTSMTNLSNVLCFGASWLATTRFAQNLQETYTLKVVAPQSVSQFGTVAQNVSVAATSDFDASTWENYTTYEDPPTGETRVGGNENYYINRDVNITGYHAAVNTVLNQAKTSLLRSHREDKVIFNRSFMPELEIYHTIALSTDRISCTGKVYSYKHTCNVTTGEAYTQCTLALSRSSGSQSETALSIPERPAYSPTQTGGGVSLGAHYGEYPQSTWNGFIGNRWITQNLGGGTSNKIKTSYPVQFIVDTPAVESAVRSNIYLSSTETYNIAIPNNSLSVTII